jgi:triosephosphate isomerase (TIM)
MKLIVGNWKMNQSQAEIKAFFEALPLQTIGWVAPQAIHIPLCLSLAPKGVRIGAQNSSEHNSGAYTGELSPLTLKDAGASFVLVGHSERRQIFKETDAQLNAKTKAALAAQLTVIFCVGETLAERESDQTWTVVKKQLQTGLDGVSGNEENLIIAYEPVWAIGTGKVASPEEAQEVHQMIRGEIQRMLPNSGAKIKLLYGGSVKPDNIQQLMAQADIDGALVGGASLKAKDYLALCQ